MAPKIPFTMMGKAVFAAVAAAILIGFVTLLPEGGSQDGLDRQTALADLQRIAAEVPDVKAEALATGKVERLQRRYSLSSHVGRATVSLALCDTEGKAATTIGSPPSLESGSGRKLLERALRDRTAGGEVDSTLVALFALGPSGALGPGEQAIGAFAAAVSKDALAGGPSIRRSAGQWARISAGLVAAACLVAGLLYWMFVRPIRRIVAVDRRVDAQAGLFPLIPEEQIGADEAGEIARARNQMVERLQEEQALARQANQMLERAEAKYRALVEASRDIVFRTDLTGRFLFASPSMETELGVAPRDLGDSPEAFFERVHPADAERVRMAFGAMTQGEPIQGIEFRMMAPGNDEPVRWLSLTHRPILDGHGRLQGIDGALRDITAAKMLEMELEDCRLRLDALHALRLACHKNLERRELFDLFARQSAEVLGMSRALVARFAAEEYRALGVCEFPEETVRRAHEMAGSPMAKIARDGRPLSLLNEKAWSAYGLDGPFVGVPILDLKGEAIGAVCCYGETRNATEGNIRAVSLIAELLGPRMDA
ncbi:MAG: PAS domain S-box protein [Candidatus Sumerlaeota bacterium]|nr:PAS domain S-box protein [Candidatus Sumerlaeota bacterium]